MIEFTAAYSVDNISAHCTHRKVMKTILAYLLVRHSIIQSISQHSKPSLSKTFYDCISFIDRDEATSNERQRPLGGS